MWSLSETKGAPTRARKMFTKGQVTRGFRAPLVHGFSFSMGCRFCCSADSGPVVKSAYTLEKQKGHCIALPHLDIYWCKTGNMELEVQQMSPRSPKSNPSEANHGPKKFQKITEKRLLEFFLAQENSRSRFFSILWNFWAPKLTPDRAKRTRNGPEGGPSAGKDQQD